MSDEQAREEARACAQAAKDASVQMALASVETRNGALFAMAAALREKVNDVVAANAQDMDAAKAKGTSEALLDRLMLDEARVNEMADALEALADLPDPVGCVLERRALYNGMQLARVSVPLGVVAVVYEARPNVTADAAGICLKSGNAVVLRGGSLASLSCTCIAQILHDAAVEAGLPKGCIQCISTTSHAATDELMSLHGVVDVLIPRGGAGLIAHCVETAKVPVIETGTGNCHVYVHASADLEKACNIIVNAKCRRLGVCNAAESLLVDAEVAPEFLSRALPLLVERGITLHADEKAAEIAASAGVETVPATEVDWATEYLSADLAVHIVNGVDEAIEHINRYGTHHSEAIVAEDDDACAEFASRVDAAAVYLNASTAFTDGGQFGLGAEIGISTQKLHVRGPFALEALTSYKYIVAGSGQVRA
ncbi:MAG: glutamate-5-semialdehyde dehydrogenase [Eggerthellaceae bacterium]|nr:glutamate-5-semialdehyde dehydrogenase [Eggerthellaceae bacterium]